MLTWKIWTDQDDPVFEGTEAQARDYIAKELPGCIDAVLESPDGDTYAYDRGAWVSLGPGGIWVSQDTGL